MHCPQIPWSGPKSLCYKHFASLKTADFLYKQWSSIDQSKFLMDWVDSQIRRVWTPIAQSVRIWVYDGIRTLTLNHSAVIKLPAAGTVLDPSQLRVLMGCNKFRQLVFCLRKIHTGVQLHTATQLLAITPYPHLKIMPWWSRTSHKPTIQPKNDCWRSFRLAEIQQETWWFHMLFVIRAKNFGKVVPRVWDHNHSHLLLTLSPNAIRESYEWRWQGRDCWVFFKHVVR